MKQNWSVRFYSQIIDRSERSSPCVPFTLCSWLSKLQCEETAITREISSGRVAGMDGSELLWDAAHFTMARADGEQTGET